MTNFFLGSVESETWSLTLRKEHRPGLEENIRTQERGGDRRVDGMA
jgi:hypothetical protein